MSKVEFWIRFFKLRGGYGVKYFSKCEQFWKVEKITGILPGFC